MEKIINSGVYRVKNLINDKIYYGSSTQNVKTRLYYHRIGKLSNIPLQRAIKKYDIENFLFEVLIYCDPENCLFYEQIFLDTVRIIDANGNLGEINKNLSYNLLPIAGSRLGFKCTKETKIKISQNHIDISGENNPFFGKTHTEETKRKMSQSHVGLQMGENNPFFGKKHTEETKKKLSENTKGKKHTEETKKKISSKMTGENNPFFGKTHTEETKRKISEKNKGKKHTEETRKKISIRMSGENNSFFGKTHTEETKKKISESAKGKKNTEEARKKISNKVSGENNGSSKLTWEKVGLIREKYLTGNYTQKELAREFNVNKSCIYKILSYETWKNRH